MIIKFLRLALYQSSLPFLHTFPPSWKRWHEVLGYKLGKFPKIYVKGLPLTDELQKVFAPFAGPVEGIIVTEKGITVTYRGQFELTFTPLFMGK